MAGLISRARPLALTALVAAATFVPGTTPAAELTLADVPLFLATDVIPNLVMAIDDSGSMDFEVLLRTNDGAAWWRTGASLPCTAGTANSFAGCGASGAGDQQAAGALNFNYAGSPNGTWKKYAYLFPNSTKTSDDSDRRRAGDAANDHFAIPPLPQFAWARSPVYNSLYFNPATQYEPWQDGGGYTFTNAVTTAVRWDPVFDPPALVPGNSDPFTPTINLKLDFAGTGSTSTTNSCDNSSLPQVQPQYYFHVYKGMHIPSGTCIRRPYNPNQNWVTLNGDCDVGTGAACDTSGTDAPIANDSALAIRYFPATFYLRSADDLPADFGYTAIPIAGEAPDGSALVGFEIKPGHFSAPAKYQAALQNFANWFTYHRKRHQALRAGLGKAFIDITKMRVAGFTINDAGDAGTSPDVTMKNIDDGTNRSELYEQFYHDWVRTGGTPNRGAVANMIRNFKRTGAGAPVQYVCQKNFGMLFTDGFATPSPAFDALNNVDGPFPAPYHDGVDDTLADGVMDAYANNLRPDMTAGKVPVPNDCNGSNPDPRLDCNRNQHMNFYAITLDSRGVVFDPDNLVDPYLPPSPVWPTSFPSRHPSAVDDLWHATVNGRGLMLNARGANEIAERLSEVLRNIIERTSSASAAAVNSGIISSETRVYQARFNTANWNGELLSFGVDPQTGKVSSTPEWDASEKLPAHDQRKIFTVDKNATGANVAVAFQRATLSALRKQQVTGLPVGSTPTDAEVDSYVNYIRGKDAAGFRERPSKLGDIVSSAPLYVGATRGRYSDKLKDADGGNGSESEYSIFAKAQQDRTPMIYVGANDGMLHAIDAVSGKEQWAFIPGAVFGSLPELTKPTYAHRYFVDGAANVGDAYFGDAWHSVLVGGLNKGGKSIYALDVTAPASASEAAATDKFLWEFEDADLGYTFSQPAVVRMHNGKWAAVFGNGYNNAGSGKGVLYVVDIADGSIIRKFDTDVGDATTPNGLATPVLVDGNGDRIVDHAYVGDLRGNLWKVDLRATDAGDWDFAFEAAGKPQPLFTAIEDGVAQPITTRPEVARGPYGAGVMVLFGTGKYLETGDNQVVPDSPKQSFYGLIDANTHGDGDRIASRNELVQQTIQQVPFDPDGAAGPKPAFPVRVVSDTEIAGTQTGWFMNLPLNGERQITDPVVRSDRVIFTTLIPTSDRCSFGGSSWLMEVDLLNGGALPSAPLDTDGDGKVDEHDLLPDGSVPSGLMADEYLSRPAILTDLQGEGPDQVISSGSSGELEEWAGKADHGIRGRQSWRQIR